MSRILLEAQLTTAAARQRLAKGLHWRSLDADVHLGYRRGIRGGRWLVRWRTTAGYRQEVIASTDDFIDADNVHCLSFHQASSKAREVVARRRADAIAGVETDHLTVRDIVEEYIAEREKRELGYNRDARYRLTRYVLKPVSPSANCAHLQNRICKAGETACRLSSPGRVCAGIRVI